MDDDSSRSRLVVVAEIGGPALLRDTTEPPDGWLVLVPGPVPPGGGEETAMTLTSDTYTTAGGIVVRRVVEPIPVAGAVEPLIDALDSRRGALYASSYEYPGRYTRWDMGFVDPPLELVTRGRGFAVRALNERGSVLVAGLLETLGRSAAVEHVESAADGVRGRVREPAVRIPEEERSKQPTVFSVVRAIVDLFASPSDPHLGLYGAFGYDLALQFEPLRLRLHRPEDQRDLVLYLPDELVLVDHRREVAERRSYEFETSAGSTAGLPRGGASVPYVAVSSVARDCDHAPGEYAALVEVARDAFRRGDLFEVVPGRTFFEPCPAAPSEVFRRLRERNPSPYGFLINLGDAEYLVGASPEMYVRVDGDRVETCPISGTIARGADPIADAQQIRDLLNSPKDESELTMCTDVDRNDKARVCVPGSVKVIGRRQIEMYSRLIHTVDHVEGRLRPGFDALDAFLTHAWAVTVTGAPKVWAMQFVEDNERAPRAWYGGAVGVVGFDGRLNTGLTLRTIRVHAGVAEVRAGATLLYDSDPQDEEDETRLKASALLDAIKRPRGTAAGDELAEDRPGEGRRVLVVDHEDSFVHTLADYFRQTGAEVVTLRSPATRLRSAERATTAKRGARSERVEGSGIDRSSFDGFDLVVLSPGPGRPSDFGVSATIGAAVGAGLPVFGVCLGLQGIVEHFGGELGVLDYPMHGKPSVVRPLGGDRLFDAFPSEFTAGRYHSLYGLRVPDELRVTARSDDGVVMAVEHVRLPVAAVQFHPESILTLGGRLGHRLVRNAVAVLCGVAARS